MQGNDYRESVRLMIVDDDAAMLDSTAAILRKEGFCTIETASGSTEAIRMLSAREKIDLVITDIRMPGMDGMSLVRYIKDNPYDAELLVMTAYPDETKIDELENLGVHHYIFKPFHAAQLVYSVHGALFFKRSMNAFQKSHSSGMVGVSSHIRKLREDILQAAGMSLPVLVTGETGTGKEIIAQEIHRGSVRKDKSFIPVNCSTLGTLAASELFGHKAGAFTGARNTTQGYFKAADKGTLFLDEIADLPLEAQVQILRVLDSGEISPVGSPHLQRVDVRVICATNRNLEEMLEAGTFRNDLFFRLKGKQIRTLPLRDRPEDIPVLVYHFLDRLSMKRNVQCKITPRAVDLLTRYRWPGNVRELKYALYTLVDMSSHKVIIEYRDVFKVIDIKEEVSLLSFKDAKAEEIAGFEREYFETLLAVTGGRLSECLKISGMHKKNFYEKLKKYALKK